LVGGDFPCLSLSLKLAKLRQRQWLLCYLWKSREGEKIFVVVIGGDKEMKKNVYIPIGLCVVVSISKAGQEPGEYTEM